MDEKEIEEMVEENKWLKFDNKISSFFFTCILTVFALCSLCIMEIFAVARAGAVLANLPENDLATAFVKILLVGGWWILLIVIGLYFLENIYRIYREEITNFLEELNKYKLVKEEEKKV